jgi:hypothetical protein
MSSVLRYDGANVLELGVASLDAPRAWPFRMGAGGANAASDDWDCVRTCVGGGEGMPVSSDGEEGATTDLGRPRPLEPVEVEAFLAKGLLRTDMVRVSSRN